MARPSTTPRGDQGSGKGAARMPGTRISDAIKAQIADRITTFNRTVLQDPHVYYLPRYRGSYLYLDRCDYGQVGRIGRLTYLGTLERWEFAIYRYSDERYDPDEWLFPGAEELDGTIEGAMHAGMGAYPL
jgi:hypothetical protein